MSTSSWSAAEWDSWYANQASWTESTRTWLYRQAGLSQAQTVLEVGCGTGVIAEELSRLSPSGAQVVGLDVDPLMLGFARRQDGVTLVRGDAHALPFAAGAFDVVVCHYLLLWLDDPGRGVAEMARVVRSGGAVVACAEPDYGGRIDHPPELTVLGTLQTEALRQQGAEPHVGRRLGEFFVAAELGTILGTMAGYWSLPARPDAGFEAEWAMRQHDLGDQISTEGWRRLREADRKAMLDGRRVLFVPTFYALGRAP